MVTRQRDVQTKWKICSDDIRKKMKLQTTNNWTSDKALNGVGASKRVRDLVDLFYDEGLEANRHFGFVWVLGYGTGVRGCCGTVP
jgi:hypothetical protein